MVNNGVLVEIKLVSNSAKLKVAKPKVAKGGAAKVGMVRE